MTTIREGYKETEIGVIPEEWGVNSLLVVSTNKGEYGIGAKAVDYKVNKPRYLRITDIDDFGRLIKNSEYKTIAEDDFQSYILQKDDLVFARTGNTTGKTYLYNSNDGELVFAGFLIKFSIDSTIANSEFIRQYCFTKRYWDWVKQSSTRSGQPGINSKQYGELLMPNPPLPEQHRIAEILSTTDDHIEKLDKTIEDYQLLKKGMMKKLLTEGIGHTEFKETEIGRMPKEWEVKKIEEFCGTTSGGTPSRKKPEYYENGNIPWIKTGELNRKYIYDAEEYITEVALKSSSAKVAFEGAVLIAMYGATIGKCSILKCKATTNQACCVIKPFENICSSEFLYYFLAFDRENIISKGAGGAQPNISQQIVKLHQIPLPPMMEQLRIVEILSSIDERLELCTQQKDAFILLKRALMEQLLTGKIRVF